MIIREQIAGVWFEWDDKKSDRCEHERGFNFSAAAQAFFDEYGFRVSNMNWKGEERFQLTASISLGIIIVVFEIREYDDEESYRIISAREATQTEEARYCHGL